jgi:hypothetical protein
MLESVGWQGGEREDGKEEKEESFWVEMKSSGQGEYTHKCA